ncbi:MAG: aminoacyl-tRNA hydrolase [Candidatus Omnitrophica bacterium]|nr:aminoacyl-tRNA hydrolase [Candidatus Omnitrophota bacterium]
MKLIVGLGNPEPKYFETRHNAGRLLAGFIASRFSLKWHFKKSLLASTALFSWGGQETILAYPATYINVSGEALKLLTQHFDINISNDLLVVVDDAAIPLGNLRLRPKGSSGGHNGLKSIEASLGTQQYARLRFGIGATEDISSLEVPLEEFVLERFTKLEQKKLPGLFKKGEEACRLWATGPLEKAMNSINPSSEK